MSEQDIAWLALLWASSGLVGLLAGICSAKSPRSREDLRAKLWRDVYEREEEGDEMSLDNWLNETWSSLATWTMNDLDEKIMRADDPEPFGMLFAPSWTRPGDETWALAAGFHLPEVDECEEGEGGRQA